MRRFHFASCQIGDEGFHAFRQLRLEDIIVQSLDEKQWHLNLLLVKETFRYVSNVASSSQYIVDDSRLVVLPVHSTRAIPVH